MRLALFCIGGKITGGGHIYRTKLLQSLLVRNKIKSDLFILRDSSSSKQNLRNLDKVLKKIFINRYKYILIDCSSRNIIKTYKGIKIKISKCIQKTKSKIILMDALKNESLKIKNSLIYRKVIPYLSDSKLKFSGKKFILINPKLKKIKINKKDKKKINVLATFGNVDNRYTEFLINYLIRQNNVLEKKTKIKIIIGSFCKNVFFNQLNSKIKQKKIKFVKILRNQKNLINHFKWSDLVITNDGLTKYESMLAGRCTVILRKKNYKNGQLNFLEKLKISKYIDLDVDRLNFDKFEKKIFELIKNKNFWKIGKKARNYFLKDNFKNYLKLIR